MAKKKRRGGMDLFSKEAQENPIETSRKRWEPAPVVRQTAWSKSLRRASYAHMYLGRYLEAAMIERSPWREEDLITPLALTGEPDSEFAGEVFEYTEVQARAMLLQLHKTGRAIFLRGMWGRPPRGYAIDIDHSRSVSSLTCLGDFEPKLCGCSDRLTHETTMNLFRWLHDMLNKAESMEQMEKPWKHLQKYPISNRHRSEMQRLYVESRLRMSQKLRNGGRLSSKQSA